MPERNKEKKLVKKAKKDPKKFAPLYNFYFSKIYRYTAYRIGHQKDTEDLVSEIFEKALRNLNKFQWQKGAGFGSWLFRIARNTIIDYYKSKEKRKLIDLEDVPEIASQDILPDDKIRKKELFQKMQTLVNSLPPRQSEVVTLRFFGERRNKEIAQILKISEKTVASNLCRALKTLHQKYKNLQ